MSGTFCLVMRHALCNKLNSECEKGEFRALAFQLKITKKFQLLLLVLIIVFSWRASALNSPFSHSQLSSLYSARLITKIEGLFSYLSQVKHPCVCVTRRYELLKHLIREGTRICNRKITATFIKTARATTVKKTPRVRTCILLR